MFTIKCPICGREIKLKKTKKEGILWGRCPVDFFRGFFPQDVLEVKKKGFKKKKVKKEKKEENVKWFWRSNYNYQVCFDKDVEKKYKCGVCGKLFSSRASVINHLKSFHLDKLYLE